MWNIPMHFRNLISNPVKLTSAVARVFYSYFLVFSMKDSVVADGLEYTFDDHNQ